LPIAPVVAGLAVGIAIIAVFSIFTIGGSNNRTTICGQSLENIKRNASFAILIPRGLPVGYSLQSVDYVPDVYVTMKFLTKSPCDPNVGYSPEEGEIEVVESHLTQITTASAKEYIQTEIEKLAASKINATSYVFQNGSLYGVGYWNKDYLKARLLVADDKTGTFVSINARSLDTPLETLVKMGSSLKEYN